VFGRGGVNNSLCGAAPLNTHKDRQIDGVPLLPEYLSFIGFDGAAL
jgi:hypothetical protein